MREKIVRTQGFCLPSKYRKKAGLVCQKGAFGATMIKQRVTAIGKRSHNPSHRSHDSNVRKYRDDTDTTRASSVSAEVFRPLSVASNA